MKRTFFAFITAMVLAGCGSSKAGGGSITRDSADVTDSLIASRHLTIEITTMHPMEGGDIPVGSDFSLEIRGDSVISRLPYFGKAYAAPIGSGNAFNFEQRHRGLDVTKKGDGATLMLFEAKTIEDTFRFRVEIYSNGRAYIHVTSQRRQPISYVGEVVNA